MHKFKIGCIKRLGKFLDEMVLGIHDPAVFLGSGAQTIRILNKAEYLQLYEEIFAYNFLTFSFSVNTIKLA